MNTQFAIALLVHTSFYNVYECSIWYKTTKIKLIAQNNAFILNGKLKFGKKKLQMPVSRISEKCYEVRMPIF